MKPKVGCNISLFFFLVGAVIGSGCGNNNTSSVSSQSTPTLIATFEGGPGPAAPEPVLYDFQIITSAPSSSSAMQSRLNQEGLPSTCGDSQQEVAVDANGDPIAQDIPLCALPKTSENIEILASPSGSSVTNTDFFNLADGHTLIMGDEKGDVKVTMNRPLAGVKTGGNSVLALLSLLGGFSSNLSSTAACALVSQVDKLLTTCRHPLSGSQAEFICSFVAPTIRDSVLVPTDAQFQCGLGGGICLSNPECNQAEPDCTGIGGTCNTQLCICSGAAFGSCRNGTCDSCEDKTLCSFDCGDPGGTCGDGKCGKWEDANNCPSDCPNVEVFCSQGSVSCIAVNCDCKSAIGPDSVCQNGCCTAPPPPPSPYCGDGQCNGTETAQTCAFDCGGDTSGAHVCGNGINEGPEICEIEGFGGPGACTSRKFGPPLRCSLSNNCVACETWSVETPCDNDGACEEGENPCNCPSDCRCGNGRCDLRVERGTPCPGGTCPTDCDAPQYCPQDCKCGNGVTETGEQCDDGDKNGTPGDPCNQLCQFSCGDGQVEQGEDCDFIAETSSNPVCFNTFGPGWTCNTSCHCAPGGPEFCGNGVKDVDIGEFCDGTDGCNVSLGERCNHFCDFCESNRCDQDGFAEVGEQCDVDFGGNTFTPTCQPGQTCSRCQCISSP